MIGANLQRLDRRGKAVGGPSGTMWTAGFDPAQPPYDFRYTSGRPAREGREVIVERGWARERGLTLGDTIPVSRRQGGPSSVSSASSRSRAACPSAGQASPVSR